MQFSLSWLKEFVDTKLTPEEIAHALTMMGLEVDKVSRTPLAFEGVVVGEVVEAGPHPEADRLKVAQVSDGSDTVQVVCGAANCRAGLKVAFARVGAKIQESTIKKGKLRGVESYGMLCSETELQIGEDDSGIAELSKDWVVGKELADYIGDTLFEVSLTPNLGHCFSVLGIARELAAVTQEKVTRSQVEPKMVDKGGYKISLDQGSGCAHYSCVKISGVKVSPSPKWLQSRLEAAGVRPINSVVDATNYAMMSLGQPLHAFDLAKLQGDTISVRQATDRESLTTLDDIQRQLTSDVMVVCDSAGPVAVAGVIGGKGSEVTDATESILLEGAYFKPNFVRQSSKQLQLKTESSKRFERGVDPAGASEALLAAATLIQDLTGGTLSEVVTNRIEEIERPTITCRLDKANRLLGTQLGATEAVELLQRLDCEVELKGKTLSVLPPTYRHDLTIEADLIEELGRLYGYNNIVKASPTVRPTTIPHSPAYLFEQTVRQKLLGSGLQELYTSSLISPTEAEAVVEPSLGVDGLVSVLNPSSIEQSVLRSTLLPGLLGVVRTNGLFQNFDVAGFEIGQVHFKEEEQLKEQAVAAIVLAGKADLSHWGGESRSEDFFDLKGVVETLLDSLHCNDWRFQKQELTTFHPGRQAACFVRDRQVGVVGEVHPALLRAFDTKGPVLFAEINLSALRREVKSQPPFEPLPQFPGSTRDWTVTVTESTESAAVIDSIKKVPSRLLKNVTPVAIYRSKAVGEGWKNVTYRFVYRDDRKTVLDKAVDAEHKRIVENAIKQLAEKVRT